MTKHQSGPPLVASQSGVPLRDRFEPPRWGEKTVWWA
jgi:hypothetical protein